MAENEFQFHTPASSNYTIDITKSSSTIVEEEGPRNCPLCGSVVRKFFINFHTKIRMCTNLNCEYPFGGNFTVYTTEDGVELSRKSRRSNRSTTSAGQSSIGTSTLGTNSNLSASEWGDINPSSQAYDSDDNFSTTSSKVFTKKSSLRQIEKRAKKQEDEKHIKQNVEKIKECNKVLFDGSEEFGTILNEKWIKNLSSMQSTSGIKLVKDRELQKLKRTQANICHGELKIDIESKKDAMSSIVIEIGNVTQAGDKEVKKT